MWPRAFGVGAIAPKGLPDCRNGGSHRYGGLHFLPVDKSVMIRACRLCASERIIKFQIVDGQIQEAVIIPDGQLATGLQPPLLLPSKDHRSLRPKAEENKPE